MIFNPTFSLSYYCTQFLQDFNRRDHGFPTEEESVFEPDEDESFVPRTTDQSGTDWEDGLKKWTNR
jgi:hypothetical protein